MATPQFGARVEGVTGLDSYQIGRNIELLELTDGLGLQIMRRIARENENIQRSDVTAWGITPTADLWPDSVTLSAQEENIPHEIWTQAIATDGGTDELVAFDAMLIFRARVTFSVSGKCSSAVIATEPQDYVWPTTWSSALGALMLSPALISGTVTAPVLSAASVTKVAVDWNQFNYEYTWIVQGVTGSNLLTLDMLDTPADKYAIQKTWTLAAEGFGSIQEAYEIFPTGT